MKQVVPLLAGLFAALLACGLPAPCVAAPGVAITDINTDQSRYAPGKLVTILVDVKNQSTSDRAQGAVTLYCKHLDRELPAPTSQPFILAPGQSVTLTYSWTPPATDFQGYSVEAWARDGAGQVLDNRNSAVDVSSLWTHFPRYGYYGAYPARDDAALAHEAWQLKNYHLNAIQFYDCEYKTHIPLAGTVTAPATSWPNLSNQTIQRRTLLGMINAGHRYGIAAMQYNLIYGAWSGYRQDGVDYHWGLFKDSAARQQDADLFPEAWHWATSHIYLFNPGDPGWQKYILDQESDMLTAYPFDGWHADSLGDHGYEYTFSGKKIEPWRTFAPFLQAARTRLNKAIVFNNVGAYGLYDTAANSGEDAVYVEGWEFAGQKTYNDLKNVVDQASSWSKGKGVIIAAYNDKSSGDKFSETTPGSFNAPGVLLTDAALFAAGASHIEIGMDAGDDLHLLDSDYFPNHKLLPSPELLANLRDYYDFLVAYENLLQGRLTSSGNTAHLSVASSPDGQPNTVWAYAKTGGGYHLLNLINLLGEANVNWRDDNGNYPAPTPQTNVDVRYYCGDAKITGVHWATPDRDHGKSNSLPFTTGTDAAGRYVQFTVPSLAYWDMVYLTVS